jgi:hypothetical protein
MGTEILARRFAEIGARIKLDGDHGTPRIDVGSDARGEFYDVRFVGSGARAAVEVIDVRRADRHLLLLVRDREGKSKFLCGHDERHWFVAAVPESARGVTGVASAKDALQPELVRAAIGRVRPKDAHSRRNAAFVRQGEWFFVPVPGLVVALGLVLHDEPLSRGSGSKPHVMQFAHRRGGETVWVSRRHRAGISDARYRALSESERRAAGRFTLMIREPEVFARGAVRHSDHATVVLRDWHRVAMNTERSAQAMRHVAFLD